MAAYVDYAFYTDVFGGAAIPEADFLRYALRASRDVDRLTRYRIQNEENPEGYLRDDKVRSAVCAVAEVLFNQEKADAQTAGGIVSSETVSKHSVSFNVLAPDEMLKLAERKIRKAAQAFLATTGLMHRGVGKTCGL